MQRVGAAIGLIGAPLDNALLGQLIDEHDQATRDQVEVLGERLLAHGFVASEHAKEPGLSPGKAERSDSLAETFGGSRADLGE